MLFLRSQQSCLLRPSTCSAVAMRSFREDAISSGATKTTSTSKNASNAQIHKWPDLQTGNCHAFCLFFRLAKAKKSPPSPTNLSEHPLYLPVFLVNPTLLPWNDMLIMLPCLTTHCFWYGPLDLVAPAFLAILSAHGAVARGQSTARHWCRALLPCLHNNCDTDRDHRNNMHRDH